MNQTFKVNVNNSFDFDIDAKEISGLDIVDTTASHKHVLHNNQSYKVVVIDDDFQNKLYKVKINNHFYNVIINNNLDELIKNLGFEIGTSKKIDKIMAPMPGLILEISVAVGAEVQENDSLLILEAMKMENVITSPRAGVIKTIAARKGDAVEKNQLLIEFE